MLTTGQIKVDGLADLQECRKTPQAGAEKVGESREPVVLVAEAVISSSIEDLHVHTGRAYQLGCPGWLIKTFRL